MNYVFVEITDQQMSKLFSAYLILLYKTAFAAFYFFAFCRTVYKPHQQPILISHIFTPDIYSRTKFYIMGIP